MKNLLYSTSVLVVIGGLLYSLSPSMCMGIFIGVVSSLLIRAMISVTTRLKRFRMFILLSNFIKFFVIVLFLYFAIRWLKMDTLMIAIGYAIGFIWSIFEIYLRWIEES